MKILKCDQCGSTERDVKTYTYSERCINPQVDVRYIYNDGIAYHPSPHKEFCDDCAGIIQEAYKYFLEEHIP